MKQGIAITGYGIICSIGTDKDSVLRSLQQSRSGIGSIRHLHSSHKELPVGEVKMSDEEMKKLLGITSDKEISRTSLLGAIALRQAMFHASLTPELLQGKKVLFISGTTVGGMDVTERHYAQMLADDNETAYVKQHDCGSNTQEIAALCGLKGEFATISTACSSALNAIILGARMLLAHEADIVIAGGSEALSRFHLNGFNSLMILDNEPCRPFDAGRKGLNLGEGAAYLVLERSEHSTLRKANVQGYIGGWGNRCDAFHQTATSRNGEGAFLAMNDAIAMAGISPKSIDYINAHGTGTPDNDSSESAAIRRLFNMDIPPVSSTKSFTGHTTSASGSIEAVICLLAVHHRFIPTNLNWSNGSDECIVPYQGEGQVSLHHVLCNSFGFGGNDSALVLSDKEVLLEETRLSTIKTEAESEVFAEDDLKEIRRYISPIEARRMSKIMKASLLTSMYALEKAGVENPDAIIIATRYGMLEQGEKILNHLVQSGEEGCSPTLFMQSTHNTIAGSLAIRLKCHGYNITYSHGDESLSLAIKDARLLISEGKAKSVLIGVHDQCPDTFRNLYKRAGSEETAELYSKSLVITHD